MLDIIKENSLNESTLHTDIADTDEIISSIVEAKYTESLAYQICDVQPLHGPTGATYGVKNNIKAPTSEVLAQAQIDTTTIDTVTNSTLYTITIDGIAFDYTSDIDALISEIADGLVNSINILETNGSVSVTASNVANDVVLTADVAGTAFIVTTSANMTNINTTPNIEYQAAFAGSTDFELIRNTTTVINKPLVSTGFTQEVLQDMKAQFGKEAKVVVGRIFAGVSAAYENSELLSFLDTNAAAEADLTLTVTQSAEAKVMEVAQKIGEVLLSMNETTYRGYRAFVILPHSVAASFLSIGGYFKDSDTNPGGLFIGKTENIHYFVNPDPVDSTCFVGIMSEKTGSSAVVFSPYQYTLIEAIDPDTAENKIFMVNRFAITPNALSTTGNEMMKQFEII